MTDPQIPPQNDSSGQTPDPTPPDAAGANVAPNQGIPANCPDDLAISPKITANGERPEENLRERRVNLEPVTLPDGRVVRGWYRLDGKIRGSESPQPGKCGSKLRGTD